VLLISIFVLLCVSYVAACLVQVTLEKEILISMGLRKNVGVEVTLVNAGSNIML